MTAIGIILFAKVMVQATLFTEYLNEHDSKEEKPNSDSLPRTQPQGEAYKINERSRQHGIAIQTRGASWHPEREPRQGSQYPHPSTEESMRQRQNATRSLKVSVLGISSRTKYCPNGTILSDATDDILYQVIF